MIEINLLKAWNMLMRLCIGDIWMESLVDSLHQEISDFISITGQTIEDFFVESSLRKIEFGSNSNTNKKS